MAEKAWTARDRVMYRRGVRAAAQFAGTFDKQIQHPYRFEDVILYKFNLRRAKPRRKPRPPGRGPGEGE